jgi:micrococcal nuclease
MFLLKPFIRFVVVSALITALAKPETRAQVISFAERTASTAAEQLASITGPAEPTGNTSSLDASSIDASSINPADVIAGAAKVSEVLLAPSAPTAPLIGRVVRVLDGDTVLVRVSGKNLTVRAIGVNAPESVKKNSPVECFGLESSAYLKALLPKGKIVSLTLDRQRLDKYGRTLAYIALADGTDVQRQLLSQGYASTMKIAPNTARAKEFEKLQRTAKASKAGMWGVCPNTGS